MRKRKRGFGFIVRCFVVSSWLFDLFVLYPTVPCHTKFFFFPSACGCGGVVGREEGRGVDRVGISDVYFLANRESGLDER